MSRFFKRQNRSLFKAIGGYLNPKTRTEERIKATDRIKSFLFESEIEEDNGVHLFAIDMTRNVKEDSLKS